MELDANIISELRAVFYEEAQQQLNQINRKLLLLEQGTIPDVERVESSKELLRLVHTLKGNAASVGLSEIEKLVHRIENSLKQAHGERGFSADESPFSLWFEAFDLITLLIKEKTPVSELHEAIETLYQKIDSPSSPATGKQIPTVTKKAKKNVHLKPKPSRAQNGPSATAFTSEQPNRALLLSNDDQGQAGTDLRIIQQKFIRVHARRLEQLASGMSDLLAFRLDLEQNLNELKAEFGSIQAELKQISKQQKRLITTLQQAYDQERVDSSVFQVARNWSYEQNTIELGLKRRFHDYYHHLQQIYRKVKQASVSFKGQDEEVRSLRMTPVAELFGSFHRYVRDIAHEMGKQIEFSAEGETVELDRNMIQELREPVLHLLRNALDHGLEAPEERLAQSKPIAGHLVVRASATEGGVTIEVEDDGRGIDLDRIKEKALNLGLINAADAEKMTEKNFYALLFKSGFSTRDRVSLVSGRGVGLDVVQTWVEQSRGRIEIDSRPNQGTTIRMRLPLSLASMPALLVEVNKYPYAIPLTVIDKIVHIQQNIIKSINGRPALLSDQGPIPLAPMAQMLQSDAEYTFNEKLPIVICRSTGISRGWIVDKLLGEREIVIKPFSRYLKNVPLYTGATVSAKGDVILVLNIVQLHRLTAKQGDLSFIPSLNQTSKETENVKILVVDDSITTRTLEKLILTKAGYSVMEASDGLEALNYLKKGDFDLVVADIQMPNLDGITLTEKIRKTPNLTDLPIILISFLETEEDKLRGLHAGANAYIPKNQFNQQKLLEMISHFL
ncbi:response regulator [bacterium]|nr:response regulator [bacterium]